MNARRTSTSSGGPGSAPAPPPEVASLDEDQRRRRARIVEAAVGLLLTTEYEKVQMRDVTASAGVALGTTYRYFASKDHLMAEALASWAMRFPTEPPDATGRSVDQLRLAYRRAVRALEPNPTVYGAIIVLQMSADPYAAPVFERFAARQTAAFESYLPRLKPERRTNVIRVMSAVLHTHLRAWTAGREPVDEVYRMLDVAAGLLLGD